MEPVRDEARLARAAAAGDGRAFAELYGAYERRIYTYCHRIVGTDEDAADATQDAFLRVLQRLPKLQDRELNFGAYLYTAARNASYDVIGRRKKADPVDLVPDAGARPLMGDEHAMASAEHPERRALAGAHAAAVRAAHDRLPERQREVLVLREVEELSYDDIGELMGMNRNAVAQLISRARIKLRGELRADALASIAVTSPDCERALPLIAMEQDGQLRDEADAAWLGAHVGGCATCTAAVEAMSEAGIAYRALAPVVPAVWLFRDTMAKAAELTGADWSDVIAEGRPGDGPSGDGASGDGASGDGSSGDGPSGDGSSGDGASRGDAPTEVLATAGAGRDVTALIRNAMGDGPALAPAAAPATAADDDEPDAPAGGGRRRRALAALLGVFLLLALGVALVQGDDEVPAEPEPALAADDPPVTAAAAAAPKTTTTAARTTTTRKADRPRTTTTAAATTTVVTTTTPEGEVVRRKVVRRPTRTTESGGLQGQSGRPAPTRTTAPAPPAAATPAPAPAPAPVPDPPPATTEPPVVTQPPTTQPPTTTTTPPSTCVPGAPCPRPTP